MVLDNRMQEIAMICREARDILGYTQKEVALLVGRAQTQIYKREKGMLKPSDAYLEWCRLICRVQREEDGSVLLAVLKDYYAKLPEEHRTETSVLYATARVCQRHGKYRLADQVFGLSFEDDEGRDEVADKTKSDIDQAITVIGDISREIRDHKQQVSEAARVRYEQALLIMGQLKEALRNAVDSEDSEADS